MRAAILASLTAGAMWAGVASAGDLTDPVWTQAPGRADWAKAYPAHAAQAGIAGDVKLRCAVTAGGALSNCAVIQETPAGEGFGSAALLLSDSMQMRSTALSGRPVSGQSVVVPVKFNPGILQSGMTITQPDWVQVPSNDEMLHYWPAEGRTLSGKALIRCVVSNRGLLEQCAIVTEDPPGRGFGGAALGMSQSFLMRPMTVDGRPVGGGTINIPIHFAGPVANPGDVAVTTRVLSVAPWSATPTLDQMSAAFPKGAIGKAPSGHVVLRCGLKTDRTLKACETVSEEPKGLGFDRAARSLLPDFQVLSGVQLGSLSDLAVDVPFDFHDPDKPVPPLELPDPMWLRGPDPAAAAKAFPAEAAKAGLKTGVGMVDCTVAHDGSLKDCKVSGEDPPGMGFGAGALEVSGLIAMNPWTRGGAPVEGALVRVPIRLELPPISSPPAAKP